MRPSFHMPSPRRIKRIKNRLAKKRLDFIRFEQDDSQLLKIRVIFEARGNKTLPHVGRCFAFPRQFVNEVGPRVVADAILCEYRRAYPMGA